MANSLVKFQLTQEQADIAIDLAHKGRTIRSIADEICVELSSFAKYRRDNLLFQELFNIARQDGLEVLADDLIDIADNTPDVQKARLKSDNYKWLLSKRKSHIYGDRLDVTLIQKVDIMGALSAAKNRMRDVSLDKNAHIIDAAPQHDESNSSESMSLDAQLAGGTPKE